MINETFKFLSLTQGKNKLSFLDYLAYSYLIFSFLIIFLPVLWLGTNSLKSQFLIQSLDTRLLPYEYKKLARATVYDENGKQIIYIKNLPKWVLNWKGFTAEEKNNYKKFEFVNKYIGNEYYALRSHLGIANELASELIKKNKYPDCVLKYPTLFEDKKNECDVNKILQDLDYDEKRLLSEYLEVDPYKKNGFTSQILLTAPDPESGIIKEYAVSRLNLSKPIIRAKSIENPSLPMSKLQTSLVSVEKVLSPSWSNYTDPLMGKAGEDDFNAVRCFNNTVFVTIIGTIITVLINSMAAFALSKYKFNGQIFFLVLILATLMVPASVLMVGIFKMVNTTGMAGNLWGVLIPACATPAGVFMVRQYMLTIPDELLDAARMDAASEWNIFWKIVFPLSLPAIAVLGILSILWKWNDLIHPMIAVSTSKEAYTVQMCLLSFSGEYEEQEHYRLAMTVLSLIPTTLVFVFLQRYITTGIANSGIK